MTIMPGCSSVENFCTVEDFILRFVVDCVIRTQYRDVRYQVENQLGIFAGRRWCCESNLHNNAPFVLKVQSNNPSGHRSQKIKAVHLTLYALELVEIKYVYGYLKLFLICYTSPLLMDTTFEIILLGLLLNTVFTVIEIVIGILWRIVPRTERTHRKRRR